jgi:hypothetical protein
MIFFFLFQIRPCVWKIKPRMEGEIIIVWITKQQLSLQRNCENLAKPSFVGYTHWVWTVIMHFDCSYNWNKNSPKSKKLFLSNVFIFSRNVRNLKTVRPYFPLFPICLLKETFYVSWTHWLQLQSMCPWYTLLANGGKNILEFPTETSWVFGESPN